MTNYGCGLVKIMDENGYKSYINPSNVRKITETEDKKTIVTYSTNLQNDYGMNYFQDEVTCSAENFADAIIKAQTSGQVIDLTV